MTGSGKSTYTQRVLEKTGAVRLRSDVVRKHLHGVGLDETTKSGLGEGMYNPASTRRTYRRLTRLSRRVLRNHYPVIVDACFLKRDQRGKFRRLARRESVPFTILHCRASEPELRRRIRERSRDQNAVSEAGEEVLEQQLSVRDPLTPEEQMHRVDIDTEAAPDPESILGELRRGTRRGSSVSRFQP